MSKEQIEEFTEDLIKEFTEDLRYCHVEYVGDYGGVLTDYRETAKKLAILGYRKIPEGEWKETVTAFAISVTCTVCGEDFDTECNDTKKFNFCPNCGAKAIREFQKNV